MITTGSWAAPTARSLWRGSAATRPAVPSDLVRSYVEAGMLGRTSGEGFYGDDD
ncbi:hypothetical protein BRM3_02920 [Brachybacterium huguangmaarense]|uniref:3-hydroxyacyl-CoA dehydrogenase C-terminal domain-containing protein n=1 Tax=Brachybacterium huguangmaarense TaxID=1652028 RepID=A0ABY6G440_9MICO|nr:hypothetical protein [Brachybacterium huguangmaarense]UYG17401.1 hypothetical protein BRM3_02920 [Brachybacterium huguangmaarense]